MEFHKAANIFPMMEKEEYEFLKSDIKKNGLLEPIWTHENKIIDGRNRYNACQDLKIQPRFKSWEGKGSLTGFVVSLNLHRRHLSSSQKAVVALEIEPLLAEEAKERQRLAGKEYGRGIDNEKGIRKVYTPETLIPAKPVLGEKVTQIIAEPILKEAREQAAKITGTNRQYVSDIKKIQKVAPEKIEQIKQGIKTIPQVKHEIKAEKQEKRREENQILVDATPITETIHTTKAKFSTIVIDPPWDWGDEGDINQLGRAKPEYQTMSINELKQLPIQNISDEDCHLYLWITNRSLPKGFDLLVSWGFRYVTCLTWCKPSIGMGNYFRGSSEQILFGIRGSLPLMRKDIGTWFQANRGDGGHSSKPDEFYELIKTCSPSPRVDIFGRKERDGYLVLGAEI